MSEALTITNVGQNPTLVHGERRSVRVEPGETVTVSVADSEAAAIRVNETFKVSEPAKRGGRKA